MLFFVSLCDGYELNKDQRYINKALELLFTWEKVYINDLRSEFAWHDHSTALRLITICKLFETWKTHNWDNEIAFKFINIVKIHCEKLADESFYMENHNHGLDQDIALFVGATIFDILNESKKWKQIALDRMEKQLKFLFNKDGSYNEHSPHYAVLFCNRFLDFLGFINESNQDINVNLLKIIKKTVEFLKQISYPNGQLPNISDSEFVDLRTYLINKRLQKCGNAIKDQVYDIMDVSKRKDIVYEQGGYCSINDRKENIHLIFYSSFHSRVHKHHDDLAITLYGHNQPILIDCGKYNYNYEEKERKYVLSVFGHNTVMVDGQNTDLARLNIDKSGLTDYYFSEDISIISGTHCLYDGITHNRTVIAFKPSSYIILDHIEGYKEHKVEQIFNFNPNIKCKTYNMDIVGKIDNEDKIRIKELLNSDDMHVNLYNGHENPMRGWCSLEYNKIIPTYQAVYEKCGKKVKFATYINIKSEEESLESFSWDKDEITINYKNKKFIIINGKSNKYVFFDNDLKRLEKIDQPKLLEAILENQQYVYRQKYRKERERRLSIESKITEIDDLKLKVDKKYPQNIDETIVWECEAQGEEMKYAWYIYRNNEIYEKILYRDTNKLNWCPKSPGSYVIKVFVRDKFNLKRVKKSDNYIIN